VSQPTIDAKRRKLLAWKAGKVHPYIELETGMAKHNSETVENVSPGLAAAKYFVKPAADLTFEFGAASHAGLIRTDNQDHYIVLRRIRTQQLLLTNVATEELVHPSEEAFGMAVADGMGGGGRGELASRLAIRAAWDLASRTTSWVMKLHDLQTNELAERVEAFVYMMQQAFLQEYTDNPQFTSSGTTWTSAYLVSGFAVIAQIGDSPGFLWRDGTFQRITTDLLLATGHVSVPFLASPKNRKPFHADPVMRRATADKDR